MSQPLVVPVITGPSVILRPFQTSDVEAVLDATTDPLIPLITSVPDIADSELAAAFVRRQHERATMGVGYSFAVESRAVCVGQIGLWLRDLDQGRATIGYWIRPSSRRCGHATHALGALTRWAWNLPEVHRLQLYIEPHNVGSWRAAERVGYAREGLLRSWEVVGDERRDMFMYGVTRQH
ncbi:GNAT family N-acetyltransferase [uncultured Cellulomonas sp.]|uniref:GNAT family N-acetyltransferase n=1 Tax=uncultured Cellulomonas sp. TaxID=189682 RepID=UPI00261DD288|nr:GNAT family protein [uncultured Cellulomonas sp.]